MKDRSYYSTRTGKNPNAFHFDLQILRRLILDTYAHFKQGYYFQESFGYFCVDAGYVAGTLGHDLEVEIFRRLRKDLKFNPLEENIISYSDDDIFDIIEFLFDCISKPLRGWHHNYNDCGMHYTDFDKEAGQQEFKEAINTNLKDYQSGYQLSDQGEILALGDKGFQHLLDTPLPQYDPENVDKRVDEAVRRFRLHNSSQSDRRAAVRELADVLEFLRSKAKECFYTNKDDGDLFNIINNFDLRHHNPEQKGKYDTAIWHNWMFYFYLATIHAIVRAIKKTETALPSP